MWKGEERGQGDRLRKDGPLTAKVTETSQKPRGGVLVGGQVRILDEKDCRGAGSRQWGLETVLPPQLLQQNQAEEQGTFLTL